MIIVYILFGVIVLALLAGVVMYNRFVTLIQRANEAWADIDVQLRRRYDLIPNLVETVKGYTTHERETFEEVTRARTQAIEAGGANNIKEQERAETALTSALRTLFAVAEDYPDLKANANFLELQRELADTENKIQAARRFYNTNVRDLNTSVDQFPQNIVAETFKFNKRDYFELNEDSEVRENVEVDF